MRVIDIVNSPWLIMPDKLLQIQSIYTTRLNKEKVDLSAVEAQLGRPLNNKSQHNFEVVDGVAIIDIEGIIGKKFNLMSDISGGVSTQIIEKQFIEIMNNPDILGVVLNIDSPGGTVSGTFELAEMIYTLRGEKSVIAFSDGTMTSAAYWIGSAADKIFISGNAEGKPNPSITVGSIGVVASHIDISKSEEKNGMKTTEIVAGKFKRSISQHTPLTDEGRKEIQTVVDAIYKDFVESVARNRNVSVEKVLLDMADGRTFVGQQAIDSGLVDGVSTLSGVIEMIKSGGSDNGGGSFSIANNFNTKTEEVSSVEITSEAITIETIKKDHPDVYSQALAEGEKLGAELERARIKGVQAQSLIGYEKLIEAAMFDGTSTGQTVAVQILQAQKLSIENHAKAIETQSISPVSDAPISQESSNEENDKNAPLEIRIKSKWDKTPELRAEFNNSYEAYQAYVENVEAGNIKILGKK